MALTFSRSCKFAKAGVKMNAHVAQSVEHILGKDEVSGSIPLVGSTEMDIG